MTTDNRPRPLHQRIADVATALAESHDHGLPHAALLLLREALPIVRAAETPPKADADIVSRLRNLAGFSTSNLSPTEVNLLRRDLHAAADHIENDLRQFGALADYLMANHGQRGSETGDEARARLDPMAVAPGGPGCTDPAGESAVEAALRLLKFAMARGAFSQLHFADDFAADAATLEAAAGKVASNAFSCSEESYAGLLSAAGDAVIRLRAAAMAVRAVTAETRRMAAKAHGLWQLLDDVDTADDIAKSNDVHFRELARAAAAKRERHFVSLDGQTLVESTIRQHIDLQGGEDRDKMLRGFSEPILARAEQPTVTAIEPFAFALISSSEDVPEWLPATDRDDILGMLQRREEKCCLVIKRGDKLEQRWDYGEPEDNSFGRDWAWVPSAMQDAYDAGLKLGEDMFEEHLLARQKAEHDLAMAQRRAFAEHILAHDARRTGAP